MSSTSPRPGLHPMLWVAAASVTAVSLAGVAKLTGLLPESGAPTPAAPAAVATAPAVAPAETPPPAKLAAAEAPPVAAPEAAPPQKAEHREPPAPKPAPAKVHPKPAAMHPAATVAQGNPPPADAVPAPRDAPPPGEHTARRVADAPPPAVCRDCGVVEHIEAIQQKGDGSDLGAVSGAILGGVLGHQVGEGSGKQIARIGGAVLGGIAGNEVERRYRAVSHYQVTVRLDDGTRRVIEQQSAPAWRVGDAVRIRNGEIVAAGTAAPGRRDTPSF